MHTTMPLLASPDAALLDALETEAPALMALATRMLGDSTEAADAVQEAALRAWMRRDQLQNTDALRGWLRQIVARECLRALRWRGLRRWLPFGEATPELPTPPVQPEHSLDAAKARAAVAGLPARQRQLWGLRFDEGWTVPEIAAATGLAPSSIKTHLERALRTVRASLESPHA